MSGASEKWSDWVLDRGHGGQADDERDDLAYLVPIRNRLLANAELAPTDILLDVGAGDGLIAFEAARRLTGEGHVIFSDVSPVLIEHSRRLAERLGLTDVEFVQAQADDLSVISGDSVDVVTTRSVLIYVEEKQRAFAEFYRVLRPGGRISLFEPINRYFELSRNDFWGFDATPIAHLVEKMWIYEGWLGEEAEAAEAADPMMNFGEGDLFRFAVAAGFASVRVELLLERLPGSWVRDWGALLATAPNPNAHTVGEVLEASLTPDERAKFEAHIRPLVEAGKGVMESAFAYVTALKD